MIVGVQKGGTSFLTRSLARHPKISMPKGEPHFFDKDFRFENEKVNYSSYHKRFDISDKYELYGEKTPKYIWKERCIPRIFDYNPDMKIIVCLRNPIYRAYSGWNMNMANTKKVKDKRPFRKAIEDGIYYAKHPSKQICKGNTLDRSRYIGQLENIWKYFPKEKVFILKSEEMRDSPLETVNQVCDFLNVDKFDKLKKETQNVREYPEKMTRFDWKVLYSFYKNEIEQIEKLLGWDCSDWKTFQK